jgi:fluoroquinolone transport system permease protein
VLYANYASYELRKWLRDSLTQFMLVYPLLLGAAGRYLVPFAEAQVNASFAPYYHVILAALALVVARIAGAVVAFSILDDRDDNVLYSVQVAPLSVDFFIGLKLAMVFVLSWVGSAFVLYFAGLVALPAGTIWGISFLAAFGGPLTALLINCVAKNKVEGFAAVKGVNTLVVFPLVALFFSDRREFLFALEPSFWPAKALSVAVVGPGLWQLSYTGYYATGLLYAVAATLLAYLALRRRLV